jgi:dTMP kinase
MPRGIFITFEGGEGAGKTTQLRELQQKLEKAGKIVVATREPGGTPGAEAIRKLLVNGEAYKWDGLTETLLHFAARRDHVQKLIEPALTEGNWVLCDRFYDSTYAYQGYGHGMDLRAIDILRQAVIRNLKPDVTFLLDLPVEEGFKRVQATQSYEKLPREFHEKLRQGFLTMAKNEPKRFVVVDATQSAEKVAETIWNRISSDLK